MQNGLIEHLTSYKIISEDDCLYYINETISCNANLWPTNSEVNLNATQDFGTKNRDQLVFSIHIESHMKVELDMPYFTKKA